MVVFVVGVKVAVLILMVVSDTSNGGSNDVNVMAQSMS